jgi:hypothetical protein
VSDAEGACPQALRTAYFASARRSVAVLEEAALDRRERSGVAACGRKLAVMARTWLQIRVELLGGGGIDLKPPPGRDFIVGPAHSFAQLAEAIDDGFARWDRSHLHGFTLADGRRIGVPDDDYDDPETIWLDDRTFKVAREVKPGGSVEYVFDFGDHWRHRCTVAEPKVDPIDAYGHVPSRPVAIWGWGSIPDQYGRRRP